MQSSLAHRVGGAFAALIVAAGTMTLAVPAGAAPDPANPPNTPRFTLTAKLAEPSEIVTRSGSGARTDDLTLDGWPDITAREAGTGRLKVYPHSGTFQGTATYHGPTVINYGWGVMSWLGVGNVTPESSPDVLARTSDGRLFVYPHSGTYGDTSTITPPTLLGYGWNINDLILPVYGPDGYVDLVARHTASGQILLYEHSGTFAGTNTYLPPTVVGLDFFAENVDWLQYSEMNGDDYYDLLVRTVDGVLYALDGNGGNGGNAWIVGYGWNINDTLVLSDIDGDGYEDILARRVSEGTLYVYRHRGTFDPNDPTSTYQAPVLLGYGWYINDIIT